MGNKKINMKRGKVTYKNKLKGKLLTTLSLSLVLTGCGDPIGSPTISASRSLSSVQCQKSEKLVMNAIYDVDDRQPIKQLSQFHHYANRVAGMVQSQLIDSNGQVTPYSSSIGKLKNLCSDEPYSEVPVVANCTGSLIASNLMITAAHCVPTLSACRSSTYVFNMSNLNEAKNPLISSEDDVYTCDSLAYSANVTARDIALVRLDRQVTGRLPFKINLARELEAEEPLVCIGQSEGMPLMVSPVGSYKREYRDYIMHSIDTFAGNSGAPVFSGETVVGVHAKRGFQHYVSNGSCDVRQSVDTSNSDQDYWALASNTRVLKEHFENSIVALTGEVTSVTQSGSNMTIEGWACALARQSAISIEVYDSSGSVLDTISAGENIGSKDEDFCQSGATHNFRTTIPVQNSVKLLAKFGGEEMEMIAELAGADSGSAPGSEPQSPPEACSH